MNQTFDDNLCCFDMSFITLMILPLKIISLEIVITAKISSEGKKNLTYQWLQFLSFSDFTYLIQSLKQDC